MNGNVITPKELKELLQMSYMAGLSDGATQESYDWNDKEEKFSDYLVRRCETRVTEIVERTKFRI